MSRLSADEQKTPIRIEEEVSPLRCEEKQLVNVDSKSKASAGILNFLSRSNAPPLMTIEFKNMNATVPKMPGSNDTKNILNNVSGKIESGQLVALMGPSGAGKSTLLNVLGTRFRGQCSGEVLINNEPRSKRFKKHIGYVLQHDFLLPNLTVKETLLITANLRLPNTLSKQEKEQRVDDIISAMGLTTCENTLVQLVSGGESKRVSIANELLINPSILFLDEPTSGLDSTSAFSILSTLQELCRQGRTVICSIHQPSSQMFMKFDKLLLLASANVVYFGNAAEATDYFQSVGYKCPMHYNPADFILELVTDNFVSEDEGLKDKQKIKNDLIESWKRYKEENNVEIYKNGKMIKQDADDDKVNPPTKVTSQDRSITIEDDEDEDEASKARWNTTWFQQFKILYMRAFKHRRGHIVSWLHFTETIAIAILGGLVWFRIDHNEENIQDYMASAFTLYAYLLMGTMFRSVVHFPLEQAVVTKERQSGAYRLSAFYLSKILAEFPVDIFFPLLACTLFYWFVGMADNFVIYLWYLFTTAMALLAANAFGVMLGCAITAIPRALTLLSVCTIVMWALSGFMIKDRAIPDWIIWVKYCNFFRYGYLGGMIVLMEYISFDCAEISAYPECETQDHINGQTIWEDFGVDETYLLSIILLLSWAAIYFIVAYIFLRKRTAL